MRPSWYATLNGPHRSPHSFVNWWINSMAMCVVMLRVFKYLGRMSTTENQIRSHPASALQSLTGRKASTVTSPLHPTNQRYWFHVSHESAHTAGISCHLSPFEVLWWALVSWAILPALKSDTLSAFQVSLTGWHSRWRQESIVTITILWTKKNNSLIRATVQ